MREDAPEPRLVTKCLGKPVLRVMTALAEISTLQTTYRQIKPIEL